MIPIMLNDKWRVHMLDNPPQWTLERRKVVKGKELWTAVSFCQKREALLTTIREKVVRGAEFYQGSENRAVSAEKLAQIANFPETIDAISEAERQADLQDE